MKFICLVGVLLAAAPVAADEIHLASGGTIKGVAREEGPRVIVEVPYGTLAFPRDQVARIVPERTLLNEYDERLASLRGSRDPEILYDLATWAREHGITRDVKSLLRRVVEADPNHREARRLLGYVEVEGRWKTQSEIMVARGMIYEDGRWMTPRERYALRAAEAARDREQKEKQAYERERRVARTRAENAAETYPYPFALPPYLYPSRSPSQGGQSYSDSLYYDPYSRKVRYSVPLGSSGGGSMTPRY